MREVIATRYVTALREGGSLPGLVEGDPAGGALSAMEPSDRFGWLVAPSSTVIQSSEAHTGLTADPAAELDRLFRNLVL